MSLYAIKNTLFAIDTLFILLYNLITKYIEKELFYEKTNRFVSVGSHVRLAVCTGRRIRL